MAMSFDPPKKSRFFWYVFGAGVIAMLVFIVTYEGCDERCSAKDFVHDLLIQSSANNRVQRWDRNPSVLAVNPNAVELEMVGGAIFELNQLLSKSGVTFRLVQQEPADITIRFVSKEELLENGQTHDLGSGIQGLCETKVSHDGRLKSARILVLRNLFEGDKWGTVLHEMGHAVGINGHTDRYLSSIFYESFKGGAFSGGFSHDDKMLLRFLYMHVLPGASESAVNAAFERHWEMP